MSNTVVISNDAVKLRVTMEVVYGKWFERFMKGMHSITGDDVQPDLVISIDLLHELLRLLDLEYSLSLNLIKQRQVVDLEFLCTMQGKEIMMIDLHMLVEHLEDVASHTIPFVPVS